MKEKTENLLKRWVVFLKGYWGVSGGMYALTVDVLWLFQCQRKDKHISTRTAQTEQARNKDIKKQQFIP